MNTIEMIILTMSKKYHGKCVAGIDANSGKWIRLVSHDKDSHFALTDQNLRYENGSFIKVLDVVRVSVEGVFADLMPEEDMGPGEKLQPENYLLNETKSMEYIRTADLEEVLKLHPAESQRFILGNDSKYITEKNSKLQSLGYSLILVEVQGLRLWRDEKNRLKADFKHVVHGRVKKFYNSYEQLAVTDPEFDEIIDETTYDKAYLVISLGTPVENKVNGTRQYYKFIAKIFL